MTITAEEKDLTYTHQYANYLNSLVNEIYKYGGTYDLTKDQANDLVECLPNYITEKVIDGNGFFAVRVITYNSEGYKIVTGIRG
ncbi:hypothetical protein [Bacillus velezensis]|uniref:hypothetical protein n=1 Tax=Bacillus velezensis TaxID=492670 RepID=UPI0011A5AB9A|nr:hypothetical protein [Bacillus velezensis]